MVICLTSAATLSSMDALAACRVGASASSSDDWVPATTPPATAMVSAAPAAIVTILREREFMTHCHTPI